MPFALNLRQYFTVDAIVALMGRLPALTTPIVDLFFGDQRNIPRPVVGDKDLGLPPENLPVVRRGTHSSPLGGSGGSITFIEPQPVNPSEFLSGADINNLKAMNGSTAQQEIDNIVDRLRRGVRKTTEALAIQALTGKINYWMRGAGGLLEPYEVEYGSIGDASALVLKKFDAAGAKTSDVIKGIEAIILALKAQGVDGNSVIIGCGFDVFSVLADIIGEMKNSSIATVSPAGINFAGGFSVQLLPQTYRNLETKAAVPVVPAKHLLVVDKEAGHKLLYAGLDSLDAGQQALPFFVTIDETKDPSGANVIAEAKPLPVVNVKGIIKAQVLA
jgi:hypothetical protein